MIPFKYVYNWKSVVLWCTVLPKRSNRLMYLFQVILIPLMLSLHSVIVYFLEVASIVNYYIMREIFFKVLIHFKGSNFPKVLIYKFEHSKIWHHISWKPPSVSNFWAQDQRGHMLIYVDRIGQFSQIGLVVQSWVLFVFILSYPCGQQEDRFLGNA